MSSVVFVGTNLIACGEDGAAVPPTQNEPNIEGVIYDGLATDEALLAMLTANVKKDPTQAVVVDVPAAGATLPKDLPPTLTWHVQGGSASRNGFPVDWFVRTASAIGDWIGPGNAWAHGAPVNGRAYHLVFSAPDNPEIVRVFTTELTYTFDAATWTKLGQVGKPITLQVTNAIFESNRVAVDGGPFAGESVTFSIGP
jgi:hypothetical protein